MTIRVEHGDCRDVVKTLADASVDAAVTDPPYHLVGMTKRFGAAGAKPAISGDHQRIARGFMQTQWDGTGIAFEANTWRLIGRPLRPGGFLLAFGAPRTHHRLACAIEDAGFVIQDCVMWLFGQGWPKRRDLLKPAYEPIVMAYKPGAPRFLNIDGCRIEVEDEDYERNCSGDRGHGANRKRQSDFAMTAGHANTVGRWPANVIIDDSDEIAASMPDAPGQLAYVGPEHGKKDRVRVYDNFGVRLATHPRVDVSKSAARFFYTAKADADDRFGSRHPSVKPIDLLRYFCRLVTPPGGTILDPFAGSGTLGVAALAEGFGGILIEREDQYIADIRERLAFYEGGGRHSIVAKNRSRKPTPQVGGLFDEAAE